MIDKAKRVQLAPTYRQGGLWGSLLHEKVLETLQLYPGPTLCLAPSTREAELLLQRLQQELPEAPLYFPAWESLPFDTLSPSAALSAERLSTLYQIPLRPNCCVVSTAPAALQRVLPLAFVNQQVVCLKVGDCYAWQGLCQGLSQAGYLNVSQVLEPGEFSVRGGILDIFPMGHPNPIRLEFLSEALVGLYRLGLGEGRSLEPVAEITVLPAREFPTGSSAKKHFLAQFEAHWPLQSTTPGSLASQVRVGHWPEGIEYWLPLFFDAPLPSLLESLPSGALVVTLGAFDEALQVTWAEVSRRAESLRGDPGRPALPRESLWLPPETLLSQCAARCWVHLQAEAAEGARSVAAQAPPVFETEKDFLAFKTGFPGPVVIAAESLGAHQRLLEQLKSLKLSPQRIERLAEAVGVGLYSLVDKTLIGFIKNETPFALFQAQALFVGRAGSDKGSASTAVLQESTRTDVMGLSLGAPIVHREHGVGRYGGFKRLEQGGIPAEYCVIHYASEAILYVPMTAIHCLYPYMANSEVTPPLHQLGSKVWSKERNRTSQNVRDLAVALLQRRAERASKVGFAFSIDSALYDEFCSGFPFQPTPDQQAAIEAVRTDMASARPMDRLICGDVGFGKTEIALRAAFIAVSNRKQVAVLVPTTLLAQQHLERFLERFSTCGVTVAMLSRFCRSKEKAQTLALLAQGKIDIVVGTHQLLTAQVQFCDLGLLIVDEEHRFGVAQKELMRGLRSTVDILTLTATPIPRTLYMALYGLRELSLIASPPYRRLSVKTWVFPYQESILRDAILREIRRGGQVYYVNNVIRALTPIAERLQAWFPEIRVAVGHGQMPARELASTMDEFYHQRCQVLVCSSIIETGLDVTSANTIIIERADTFGLAQLHQLRGRVGRSSRQAYAYLFYPPGMALSPEASQRLTAMTTCEALGSGFAIASQDLDLRGSGDLLGYEQSGQIQTVGSVLYSELLASAVAELTQAEAAVRHCAPSYQELAEFQFGEPALIPETFVADIGQRFSLYQRIARIQVPGEAWALKAELIDAFGTLPPSVTLLLDLAYLRYRSTRLGIKCIEYQRPRGIIRCDATAAIPPDRVLALLSRGLPAAPDLKFELCQTHAISFFGAQRDLAARLACVDSIVGYLEGA